MPLDPPRPLAGPPDQDEVQVWIAWVSEARSDLARFAAVLSTEERAALDRFRRVEDRERSVVAHGVLRALLGTCLALPPAAVPLTRDALGKPAVGHRPGRAPVAFNLAHSGDAVVVALTAGRRRSSAAGRARRPTSRRAAKVWVFRCRSSR
jgi:4'-phosphopantetheinyl transferase